MSRANPFGDLGDFTPTTASKPVAAEVIEKISHTSGFPSRKAQQTTWDDSPPPAAPRRRHTTGRNRQINIKATEETIITLYRIADDLGVPLGAVLEKALAALEGKIHK